MPNKRIFYAIKNVAFEPVGVVNPTTGGVAHGVQSAGMTTTFDLQQIFELGQLNTYELVENTPSVELTVEKVLDGYPPIYLLATKGAASATLVGRSTVKTTAFIGFYDDTQDNASGVPQSRVELSGLVPSTLSYTIPVDGPATESVTLVGNNKLWRTSSLPSNTFFDGTDQPQALSGPSGGVQFRENIIFANPTDATADENGQLASEKVSVLPPIIDGITSSGLNPKDSEGVHAAHLQGITISTDLGRQEIFELGRKTPYFRFVQFPVQVTCEITALTSRGDLVSATEDGGQNGAPAGSNLKNYTIRVRMQEGLLLDLGTRNKLQSVGTAGADATGGNDIATYTFQNFNALTVKHPFDPTTALAIEGP